MFIDIWNTFLFEPVFNGLIYIYNNWTDQSLGWAIVYLTITLRLLLLPLTIIGVISEKKNHDLDAEVAKLQKEFQHDPVLRKEQVRTMLKARRISPWAKATSLGIQVLVLVLLYEVFIMGINGERIINFLYPFVEYPGLINTKFFGFDIGATHNALWAGIVGVWIFVESYIKLGSDAGGIEKKDMAFLLFFPGAIFGVLWVLPAVKALFVFTSILFSLLIGGVIRMMISSKKTEEEKKTA